MQTLNREFRRKDKPTDVLSFPSPDVFARQGVLGDLVICVPVARAQAREQRHTLLQECGVLLVHGAMHLFGSDHQTPAQTKKMLQAERDCLKKLSQIRGLPSWEEGLIGRLGH